MTMTEHAELSRRLCAAAMSFFMLAKVRQKMVGFTMMRTHTSVPATSWITVPGSMITNSPTRMKRRSISASSHQKKVG